MKKIYLKIFVIIFMISTVFCCYIPVNASDGEAKKVYLTFDDGPIPVITEKYLIGYIYIKTIAVNS